MTQLATRWTFEELYAAICERLVPEIGCLSLKLSEEWFHSMASVREGASDATARADSLKDTMQARLDDVLRHQLFPLALESLQKKEDFADESLVFRIHGQMLPLIERLSVPFGFDVPSQARTLAPFQSVLIVLLAGFLGVTIGNQIRLPELSAVVFAAVAAGYLLVLQRGILRQKRGPRWLRQILQAISVEETRLFSFEKTLQRATQDAMSAAILPMAAMIWGVRAELIAEREHQAISATSEIADLIARCQAGFSEVIFSECSRDPERALDACIRLREELEGVGIEIKVLEQGTLFAVMMTEYFDLAGHIEEGDPVYTVYPAWLREKSVLFKGTLKKGRRASSSSSSSSSSS